MHKAILSLIDGDPLNYRLKQERRLQKKKTTAVKVSYEVLIFQHCVCVRADRKKRMNVEKIPNAFFFIWLFSLVRPCLVLLLSWGVISV